jgi:hypothetical protein
VGAFPFFDVLIPRNKNRPGGVRKLIYSVVGLFLINHHCGFRAWEILTDCCCSDAHKQMAINTLGRSFARDTANMLKMKLSLHPLPTCRPSLPPHTQVFWAEMALGPVPVLACYLLSISG